MIKDTALLTIKRIITQSNPRVWPYTGGLYVFGVAIGVSKIGVMFYSAKAIPIRGIFFYFLWFLVIENVFVYTFNNYFDRDIDKYNIKKIKLKTAWENDSKKTMIVGTALPVLLFFLIILKFFNLKILILGVIAFAANFLFNVPPIRAKNIPFADILLGPTLYLFPLFAGYIAIINEWPSFWLIIAGTIYFIGINLYEHMIDIDSDRDAQSKTSATVIGKQKTIAVSFLLMLVSGLILASYKLIYFAVIAPYAAYLILSWRTSNYESLLNIYMKTFLINNLWGLIATSYFLFPTLAKIF